MGLRLDFVCPDGHEVEMFYVSGSARPPIEYCQRCSQPMEILWKQSPSMDPDPLWSGKRIPHLINEKGSDYYTSRDQLNEAMKANHKIWDEPGIDSDCDRNAQYKKEEQRQRVKKKLEKGLPDICERLNL